MTKDRLNCCVEGKKEQAAASQEEQSLINPEHLGSLFKDNLGVKHYVTLC